MDCLVLPIQKGGSRNPPVTARCGSLLPSASADACSSDDAAAFEGLKIAIIPTDAAASRTPSPASTGARIFPGSHAYLLVPESVLLNLSLSRLKVADPTVAPDIAADDVAMVTPPLLRYALAHEMAHIKHEDYAVRGAAGVGSAVITAGVGKVAARLFSLQPQTGTLLSLWAILPAFFSYKWLCREQERRADAAAGHAGYAAGGVEYWARHCSFMTSNRLRHNPAAGQAEWGPWRSHPPAAERLHQLKAIADHQQQPQQPQQPQDLVQ